MNNEQQELLDEAYKNFEKDCISGTGKKMLKEEFINFIKTNPDFSEKRGLKIEERGLTDKERLNTLIQNEQRLIYEKVQSFKNLGRKTIKSCLDEKNIPTKLITITYKENKIESYE